ncbi:MAG: hypothetical protein ACJ746_09205 [Bryobacteraceae bacterium]
MKASVEPQPDFPGVEAFRLPPLILHPFSGPEDTTVLMASSRASLALQGFLPRPEGTSNDLDEQLLRGRYAELRMLFYIGKDLTRWMDQSAESVHLSGLFTGRRIRPETFGAFLVQHVPQHVKAKLESWGVADFCALFRRSIGLHAIFREFPAAENFSADFLRRYHRHLDQWYETRMREMGFERAEAHEFVFDLYASGEYTTLLEQSWSE